MADTPTPSSPDAAAPEPSPADAVSATSPGPTAPEPTALEATALEATVLEPTAPEPTAPAPPAPAPPALEVPPAETGPAAEAPPQPEPEPEPQPQPEPEPPGAAEPSVATTLIAPPASDGGEPSAEGGEWELLLEKLTGWLRSGRIQEQLSTARKPITLVASLIGLLLVLRVYRAVLGAIDSLPLVPGLLELAGLITLVHFSFTRLVRSRERQALIADLGRRWRDFSGGAG